MYWFIALLVLGILAFLLDREIYSYEGVRLGPRVQAWLYDRWAKKYDAEKGESQLHDDEMLAQPLLEKMNDVPAPFILDFATGTGRMSYALLKRSDFNGRIVALDISQGMLEKAAEKIANTSPSNSRVEFLRHSSMPLPFADGTFDAICCLEVLELLPDAQSALREMFRLLRPGGVLLTSRGTEAAGAGRKSRVRSEAEMTSMLEMSGFENIQITKWWKWFDRILSNKKGISSPVGAKSLCDVLKCSACGHSQWVTSTNLIRCSFCGQERVITKTGIVLN